MSRPLGISTYLAHKGILYLAFLLFCPLSLHGQASKPIEKFRQLIDFLPKRLEIADSVPTNSPDFYKIPNTLHLYRRCYESLESTALVDTQLEELDADVQYLAAIFFEHGYLLRLKWAGGIAGCPQRSYVVNEQHGQTWTTVFVCSTCMGFSRLQMRFIREFNERMEELASKP